jgi:AraC-like DNA-binding protein
MVGIDSEMQLVLQELCKSEWQLSEEAAAALIFRTIRCLRMRFRRAFGVSYRTFRLQMKMEYARELFWRTPFSISEIAHRLGYASRRKFDIAFKKQFSETPAQYRARIVESPDRIGSKISSQGLYIN